MIKIIPLEEKFTLAVIVVSIYEDPNDFSVITDIEEDMKIYEVDKEYYDFIKNKPPFNCLSKISNLKLIKTIENLDDFEKQKADIYLLQELANSEVYSYNHYPL